MNQYVCFHLSTYLDFMEEIHANVESRVGYKTGDVQCKEIKVKSDHTAPPEIEENLGAHTYTCTCIKEKKTSTCMFL